MQPSDTHPGGLLSPRRDTQEPQAGNCRYEGEGKQLRSNTYENLWAPGFHSAPESTHMLCSEQAC